jgi:hypothetical protein
MFGHCVYFTLKDNSESAVNKLIDDCHKYLAPIPGIVFYAAGTLAGEMQRPVNDRQFDVALHVVFTDKAAGDAYQVHDNHTVFVQMHSGNWEKVRVFDAHVTGIE